MTEEECSFCVTVFLCYSLLTQRHLLLQNRSRLYIEESLCVCVCVCARACSVVSDSLWPHGPQAPRLLCPRDSPGRNTGGGCHSLLQGIFLTQGLNLCLHKSNLFSWGCWMEHTTSLFFFFWFASNMLCFALFLTLGSSNFLNTVEFQASVEIKTHLIYYSWRKLFLLLSLNWTRSLLKLKFHQDDQKFGMKLKCDICSPELVSLWTDASVPHLFLQKHIQK